MAKNSPQDIENREYFSNKLNELMNAKAVRQIDLHNALGIPKSTLTGYVKGRSLPTAGNLQKLADFFGVLKSTLDPRFASPSAPATITEKITLIADQLTPPRQEKALTYLKKQLLEQKNENIISLDDYRESKTLPVIGVVTAGNGITQDDNLNIEKCFYTDEIPDDYDAIAYVVGNSMEPKIKNGDYLFIKNTPQVDYNTIGIFQVDGANYVKKLRQGYLESLNPECADIQLDESNDIRTIGEVVSIYREN
ncbi:XRE family transcriptional regulator [Streptococcus pneumoniae]|nr:XRE family transcriptional regulator [Streptococcus pneumoniae]